MPPADRSDLDLECVVADVSESLHSSARFHADIGRGLEYFGTVWSRRWNSSAAARRAASSS